MTNRIVMPGLIGHLKIIEMKSYLRFLSRNKLYTAIEVVGLSIALAFVLLIGTYVWQQYATIRNTEDHDRIYCIGRQKPSGEKFHGLHLSLADKLKDNIPEIEEGCRYYNINESPIVFGVEKVMANTAYVDKDFFRMFGCRFLAGSPDDFDNKNNVVVSESFAKANGGIENIIGMTMSRDKSLLTVSGVIEDLNNSLISYNDVFMNVDTRRKVAVYIHDTYTFVKLREGVEIDDVMEKIDHEVQKGFDMAPFSLGYTPMVMDFKEVFFNDVADYSQSLNNCNRRNLMVMTLVVILLLLSAMINFINLSAAMSAKRLREMATRIVSGAGSRSIFIKYMMESVGLCLACMTLAVLLALALEPYMNRLLNSDIDIKISLSFVSIMMYVAGAVVIGLAAAILPGAIGISVRPLDVLKGQFRAKSKMVFSKIFIVLQNAVSIVLIALAMTIDRQMDHMVNMRIGADVEDLYYLWIDDITTRGPLVEELKKMPFVENIGLSEGYPGGTFMSLTQVKKGEEQKIGMMFCDEEAFRMYGLDLVDKRTDDPINTLWVTQNTYDGFKAHGADLDDPDLVKKVAFCGPDSRFGGILSDFALTDALSVENDMWCEVSVFSTEDYCPFMSDGAGIVIKTAGNHKENATVISEVYRKFSENLNGVYVEPKDSGYINDLRTAKLTDVHNQSKIMNIFMLLSVLLSFMGLVAMSTYYSDESISDIAIRKVYGSTIEDETVTSVWKYTKVVILSCIIAIPLAVYACDRYLDRFVYRADNAWWVYVLTTLAIVTISVAAVFVQTLRAARTNPADALKKE